jgi:DNA-binding transcriptional MerR regulator
MNYTIKQVSEITGLPSSTLRYYEKEQLLPEVRRNLSGTRVYTEHDLEWISIITCLKSTDMPIKSIKKFVVFCALGDSTLEDRREMVLAHKKTVELRITELQHHLEHINFKADYYEIACNLGTETELKKTSYPDKFI